MVLLRWCKAESFGFLIRSFANTRPVGYHNQIELTFAIKDTNKESIINDGGNRIATKMAVGK